MTAPNDYLFETDTNVVSVGADALSGIVRKPSPKQAKVLSMLREKPEITLQEAVAVIGDDLYYANACRHVGVTLANMVKRGMLRRIKKGVFGLPNEQGQARHERADDSRQHDTILPMRPTTKRLDSSSPSGLQPRKTRRERDTDPAGRADNGGTHRHPIGGNRPQERWGEKGSGVYPQERPAGVNPALPPNSHPLPNLGK